MSNRLFYIGLLLTLIHCGVNAQTPWALKPYAITLPRVTTAQQSSTATVPQQAGNIVYNTEQQAVAVHNGISWGYLGGGDTGEFKKSAIFYNINSPSLYFWTVPNGVNQVLIEAWGAGAGGNIYTNLGNGTITCKGGGGGGYISQLVNVSPATSLTVQVSGGGRGAAGNGVTALSNSGGGNTFIRIGTDGISYIDVGGGEVNGAGGYRGGISSNILTNVTGQRGQDLVMAYEPRGSTDHVLNLKLGNGGSAYGTMPGGYGGQVTTLNGGSVLYQVAATDGNFPGGGGGCGYNYGEKELMGWLSFAGNNNQTICGNDKCKMIHSSFITYRYYHPIG
ncbi:hypothetical protein IC229_26040 [Spirosoma sp. BT702]|uniref:Glycine-rich domain-containing protein n=1 Tax=Spirosoma profusum TaxID=2771354 RepID=A0A926Y447_9BACT|nr:hypothetical protein [Spirosoma profusum]MBD2704133.1 hypothetical protein [Spirosoma profusum]